MAVSVDVTLQEPDGHVGVITGVEHDRVALEIGQLTALVEQLRGDAVVLVRAYLRVHLGLRPDDQRRQQPAGCRVRVREDVLPGVTQPMRAIPSSVGALTESWIVQIMPLAAVPG